VTFAHEKEGAKAGKFSPVDWLRILFALGMVTLAPSLLFAYFIGTVEAYEHTGWFVRLVLSVPAALVCAVVTWPPVWLVCRRSVVFPLASWFAVIYTAIVVHGGWLGLEWVSRAETP
jgi:hypothetical protein